MPSVSGAASGGGGGNDAQSANLTPEEVLQQLISRSEKMLKKINALHSKFVLQRDINQKYLKEFVDTVLVKIGSIHDGAVDEMNSTLCDRRVQLTQLQTSLLDRSSVLRNLKDKFAAGSSVTTGKLKCMQEEFESDEKMLESLNVYELMLTPQLGSLFRALEREDKPIYIRSSPLYPLEVELMKSLMWKSTPTGETLVVTVVPNRPEIRLSQLLSATMGIAPPDEDTASATNKPISFLGLSGKNKKKKQNETESTLKIDGEISKIQTESDGSVEISFPVGLLLEDCIADGQYAISVYVYGRHIKNSPMKIQVAAASGAIQMGDGSGVVTVTRPQSAYSDLNALAIGGGKADTTSKPNTGLGSIEEHQDPTQAPFVRQPLGPYVPPFPFRPGVGRGLFCPYSLPLQPGRRDGALEPETTSSGVFGIDIVAPDNWKMSGVPPEQYFDVEPNTRNTQKSTQPENVPMSQGLEKCDYNTDLESKTALAASALVPSIDKLDIHGDDDTAHGGANLVELDVSGTASSTRQHVTQLQWRPILSNILGTAEFPKDIQGELVLKFGVKMKQEPIYECFCFPIGCAKDEATGDYIICDTGHNVVKIFDSNARVKYMSAMTFKRPSAVAVLDHNMFAVRDDRSIQMYSKGGQLLRTMGENGSGRGYGLATDHQGNLVTLEMANRRGDSQIQVYDPASGDLISSSIFTAHFGKANSKCRFIDCFNDTLYVADLGASLIYGTKLDGTNVMEFGGFGRQTGKFNEPSGISADANGNLIIGDSRNDRVLIFSPQGVCTGQVKFDYPIKRPSGIRLTGDGHLMVMNYIQHYVAMFKLHPPIPQ